MQKLNLKVTHAPVKAYYQALGQYGQLNIDHEMRIRAAFQHLLEKCGSQFIPANACTCPAQYLTG